MENIFGEVERMKHFEQICWRFLIKMMRTMNDGEIEIFLQMIEEIDIT